MQYVHKNPDGGNNAGNAKENMGYQDYLIHICWHTNGNLMILRLPAANARLSGISDFVTCFHCRFTLSDVDIHMLKQSSQQAKLESYGAVPKPRLF